MKSLMKHLRIVAAVVPVIGALALTGSASAATPTGAFEVFKECPLSNLSVESCLFSETTGGEVTLGSSRVPIKKTIVLQGGTYFNEETAKTQFVAAVNGETLTKAAQSVPGGLIGLVKCEEIKGEGFLEKGARAACEAVFENGFTGVNVTTELARPASEIQVNDGNLEAEEGTALRLPVKFHLENPLLGSECYIGSSSEPVIWNLTTGTTSPPAPNQPISGSRGESELIEEDKILRISNYKLVDNAFAAPGVSGCGGIFSFLLDPVIDAKLALPATAGKNTAILTGSLETASATAVEKHEG